MSEPRLRSLVVYNNHYYLPAGGTFVLRNARHALRDAKNENFGELHEPDVVLSADGSGHAEDQRRPLGHSYRPCVRHTQATYASVILKRPATVHPVVGRFVSGLLLFVLWCRAGQGYGSGVTARSLALDPRLPAAVLADVRHRYAAVSGHRADEARDPAAIFEFDLAQSQREGDAGEEAADTADGQ